MKRVALALWVLSACAHARVPATSVHVKGATTVTLAGVIGCEAEVGGVEPGDAEARVSLDPERPLAILVHGMHGSRDGLGMLAAAFHADGQQALCFRYDARASLLASAQLLRAATTQLASLLHRREVLVLGHSQGGLIARAALAQGAQGLPPAHYRLVTVSSPFAGIRVARSCGSVPYHLVSFGVSYAVCRAISGDSWNQIHPRAAMVRAPAALDPAVGEHLLIVTDERDTCRRYSPDGLRCLQDDYVFSVGEQHNARIERDRRVVAAALEAGHVEVLGAQGPPRKLLEALSQHGLLRADPSEKAGLFEEQSAKSGW